MMARKRGQLGEHGAVDLLFVGDVFGMQHVNADVFISYSKTDVALVRCAVCIP
jgi:hypothetical protein